MLCFRWLGHDVVFPRGNQSSIDCHLNGVASQHKTINMPSGLLPTCARLNGIEKQPYPNTVPIEQLVAQLIVKSGNNYYLVHTILTRDELITPRRTSNDHDEEYSIFSTDTNPGQTNIRIPLGNLARWLTGKPAPKPGLRTAWLNDRLTVDRLEVPAEYAELVEQIAWPAADPDAIPEEYI